MSSHPSERRRHQRIKVDKAVLKTPGLTALDMSESGMGLSCAKAQSIGKELALELDLNGQALSIKSIVRWCSTAKSIYEGGYHVGVEFEGHSISNQLLIREFIANTKK